MKNSIIEKTSKWLTDPKRTYIIGLAIFNLCASFNMKKGYGAYLNDVEDEEVNPFDARYNLLVNKVSVIYGNMKINPEKYLEIDAENSSVSEQVKSIVALKGETQSISDRIEAIKNNESKAEDLTNKVKAKKGELDKLQPQLKQLKDDFSKNKKSSDDKNDLIDKLTSQIGEKEKEVDTLDTRYNDLERQIEDLKNSGEGKTKEIKVLEKAVKTLKTKNKTLTDEIASLGKQLEDANTEKDDFEAKTTGLDSQISELSSQIDDLTTEKEELEDELFELQGESENKDSQIEDLEKQLEEKSKGIDVLKKEIEGKGYSVVTDNDLPAEYQEKKKRIKEIVPLMAKIHAELSDPTLSNKERKAKAGELCTLDDERRGLWDDIDEYLAGKKEVLPEDKALQYSDDAEIGKTQMQLRLKRLKEKINRNIESARKHAANNKPNYEAQSLERVARYRAELGELQLKLDETK